MEQTKCHKLLLLPFLVLALAGCIPHADGSEPTEANPTRVLLIGDSITTQFGPRFAALSPAEGAVTQVHAWPGLNPTARYLDANGGTVHNEALEWANVIAAAPAADYVIIQDYSMRGFDGGAYTAEQYAAAFQAAIDAGNAKGSVVIVLDGIRPDEGTPTGIDRRYPMVPADDADGIHYTPLGARAQASLLIEQLVCDCSNLVHI